MSINITNKTIEDNLKQIVSKTDFLDREQYLQARTTADLKLLKQNKRLTLWSRFGSSLIYVRTTTQTLSSWSSTRRQEQSLEQQEDLIRQRPKHPASGSSEVWSLMMFPSWPAEGFTERALQRLQGVEGLNMLLDITQAKEDDSRVSGTLRGTLRILTDHT